MTFISRLVMAYIIERRLPTVEEYDNLRCAVGWPTLSKHVVERGLANTLYAVVVLGDRGDVVAMGRIVGDDAIYMHIQDVIVRPEHQRQGIGHLIMKELLDYVDRRSEKNTNIGLMCSKGREAFYRNFGFVDRPNEKFGSGMIKVIE